MLVENEHRRSLVDMAEISLAIGAKAGGGNPREHGAVLVALVLIAKLQGAQYALEVQEAFDYTESFLVGFKHRKSFRDDVSALEDLQIHAF